MRFRVLPVGRQPPQRSRNVVFLLTDNWDDWFKYNTLYGVAYFDQEGERHDLGGVKIGQFNMLFRLKSPRNVIGGFGVFSHASKLPISLAWEAFGIKNGARTPWTSR